MGLKVLSLFDGISCGMVALERAGVKVDSYYAYEIDRFAIQCSKQNYPSIIHKGDVVGADFSTYRGIDLLIGGSPCQNLSQCGDRTGLEGKKSSLFFEFLRAKEEASPKYFLLENNASMTKENKDIISNLMGVQPVFIDSASFSAQTRKRLYWTNIPISEIPPECGLTLGDIVEPTESKENCYHRMMKKKEGTLSFKKCWSNVRSLNQKSKTLTTTQRISTSGSTNIKYSDNEYYIPTPIESERLQTLPDGYTAMLSNTQRYKTIGNGWTVDVIAHIFKGLSQQPIKS